MWITNDETILRKLSTSESFFGFVISKQQQ